MVNSQLGQLEHQQDDTTSGSFDQVHPGAVY